MVSLAYRENRDSSPPSSGIRTKPVLQNPSERTFGEQIRFRAAGLVRTIRSIATTVRSVEEACKERTPIPPEVAFAQLKIDPEKPLVFRVKE